MKWLLKEDLEERGSLRTFPKYHWSEYGRVAHFNWPGIENSLGRLLQRSQGPRRGEGGAGDRSVEGELFPKLTRFFRLLCATIIVIIGTMKKGTTVCKSAFFLFKGSIQDSGGSCGGDKRCSDGVHLRLRGRRGNAFGAEFKAKRIL